MADTFNYKPKFVDIRINKAGKAKPEAKAAAADRPCDQIGCKAGGAHRAPKARGRENEFWWFCAAHAAEYNRRWNYFDGMSDTELKDYESAERSGHRPTWTFRAARGDRLSAAAQKGLKGKAADPLNILGSEPERQEPRHRHLGRLQMMALEVLGLDERADGEAVRARYAELVKRYHPDSNGGDRTAEAHLHKVIRAYQTLKAAKLG